MARVFITGANGMLGTDLCNLFENEGYQIFCTDIENLDVCDFNKVQKIVDQIQPDYVIHLAALTDVDKCEREPDKAFQINTIGTQHVALACQKTGALMIYVSTLSVFDGRKYEPYTEFDTPNPKSWYSRSKYRGELVVEKHLNKYYIVRAGWMFGGGLEDKKFVAKIMELASKNGSINAVDDKFGSPTYTRDISCGIEQLIKTGLYGTYHMVNTGGYCSRFEFAKAILEYAGNTTCAVHPVSSAVFPLPAPRPRMEAARNYSLELQGWNWMPAWRNALKGYINTVLLPERETVAITK
jgi:dTDP-4-dehydrorhamnose reductase